MSCFVLVIQKYHPLWLPSKLTQSKTYRYNFLHTLNMAQEENQALWLLKIGKFQNFLSIQQQSLSNGRHLYPGHIPLILNKNPRPATAAFEALQQQQKQQQQQQQQLLSAWGFRCCSFFFFLSLLQEQLITYTGQQQHPPSPSSSVVR